MNYGQTFLLTNSANFTAEAIPMIQKEMSELDDQSVNALLSTEIKNPTTGLLLGIFLGEWGADRFYNKDTGLAIGKLALTILGVLTSIIGIGVILLMAVYVWKIVDCCLIMGAIRQRNVERLMFNIQQVKIMSGASAPTTGQVVPTGAVVPQAPVQEEAVSAVALESETATSETDTLSETVVATEAVVDSAPVAEAVSEVQEAVVEDVPAVEGIGQDTTETLDEEAAVVEVAEEAVVEEVSAPAPESYVAEESVFSDASADATEG